MSRGIFTCTPKEGMEALKQLIEGCINNERRAQKQFYEHCFHKLMPVCYRYHKDEEDARAVLNIAFMKILKNLSSYNDSIPLDAWIKRITINTLIDEYRKQKRYSSRIETRETERELDYHANSTTNDALSNFEVNDIKELLEELPSVSKKVFNLYVIDGYNHAEIGDLLGISDGTSKWHLSNARKKLRQLVAERLTDESKLAL